MMIILGAVRNHIARVDAVREANVALEEARVYLHLVNSSLLEVERLITFLSKAKLYRYQKRINVIRADLAVSASSLRELREVFPGLEKAETLDEIEEAQKSAGKIIAKMKACLGTLEKIKKTKIKLK